MDDSGPTETDMARQGCSLSGGSSMNTAIASISPVPTEEEAAAIVAAVTLTWPQPVVASAAGNKHNDSWRFSGRWWVNDAISRRTRPGA